MNKLKLDNELCHVKIEEDYLGFPDEDKVAIKIRILDGPFKGAVVEAEVDKDGIQDEYIDED